MNKILAFGVVLVVVATAYEFDDPEYNQILASDLDDLYSASFSHPRNRRDDKAVEEEDKCRPPRRKNKLCCAEEEMEKIHNDQKVLKRACFKEITGKDKPERPPRPGSDVDPFDCESINKHKQEMTCVFQCVGQKKNLLDDSGSLKEDEISKHIKDMLTQLSYDDAVQDKIVATCIAEAKNATDNRDVVKQPCNPVALKVAHCLFKEIQLNCPADQIKDQKFCTKFQERLKQDKGGFFHGHHPPPPPPGSEEEGD